MKSYQIIFWTAYLSAASSFNFHATQNELDRKSILRSSASDAMNDLPPTDAVPIVLGAALLIGLTAQTWINFQLSGDRGLGNFLSDGSGFGRSAFKPRQGVSDFDDGTAPLSNDPMPWLKLPELDFVEVAGQNRRIIVEENNIDNTDKKNNEGSDIGAWE
mmetsp:Transcript_14932/g.19476  ORF Transcript_14932/g.19476 Transcript_14932/m.19476 type:complete len:160 (-) Transcript_14932:1478-1957(-)